jgi:hypothetical protein
MVSKAQVMALCAGDAWLEKGANLILLGPPSGGKSHLSSAMGLALLEKGWRVFFTRTSELVQRLLVARRELALESAIHRLDRFDLLILDDITYVSKDQAETSVLFELISARYERRSMLITANQPFGEWGKIFPDPAMTLAAVRLTLIGLLIAVPPANLRQFSGGHVLLLRIVPPANTLVRWVDENAFASIVQARPCPTFGRPVHLRSSLNRLRPDISPHALRIPPRGVHPAIQGSRLGRRGVTPVFGNGAPHPGTRGTSTLPSNTLLGAQYEPLRHPMPPGLSLAGVRLDVRPVPRHRASRVASAFLC